jgi:3-hydroxyacyl-CoA dehydrogenase/enoyl-CoA hydratase/3-hydroxybutyryl-CoA epimerase
MVTYRNKAGFGIIVFNDPGSKVNVLSSKDIDDLKRILSRVIKGGAGMSGLFFISSKKDVFIAGADIKELASIKNRRDALVFCAKGQAVFNMIEGLRMPTFAVLNGACIGGGLELALSCDNILSTENKKIKIGFPEVKLEISPGFGGVHRLKEKIGIKKADRLLRTGRLLTAIEAKRTGIVDKIIPEELLKDYKKLLRCIDRGKKDFPGPRQCLDKKEREILAGKIIKEPARNALNAFLLAGKYRDSVKYGGLTGFFKRCAVIGAGTMGRDISYLVSSRAGLAVSTGDADKNILKDAKAYIKSLYNESVEKGIEDRDKASGRFKNISFSLATLKNCDIVIECVTEDLWAKKKLFSGIESEVNKDCVIATNTSCLSVSELGRSLARPERFIGTHFFNPAYKMKLVEVTPAGFTDRAVTKRVVAFLRGAGRVPVVVKDSPGFLVNRMLLPYLNEAARMIEEGFLIKDIDSVMLDFGMPVGPIKLINDIGLNVAYKACKILESKFKDRIRVPDILKTWSGKKRIFSFSGKAVKKGAYRGIVNRLLKPMKTEAALCLKEGVVDRREVIDLALLLGAGFPASKRVWKI